MLILCLTLAAAVAAQEPRRLTLADGGRFALEVQKSGLFSGKKHVFSFPELEGVLRYDPANPGGAQVEFSLAAAGIRLEDQWLSEKDFKKVRDFTVSREMLDAANHPRITFRSTRVEPLGGNRFKVTGDLAIRGITRPVNVNVAVAGDSFTGDARFPMTAFGLKPPKAALGAIGTRDEIVLTFTLSAR